MKIRPHIVSPNVWDKQRGWKYGLHVSDSIEDVVGSGIPWGLVPYGEAGPYSSSSFLLISNLIWTSINTLHQNKLFYSCTLWWSPILSWHLSTLCITINYFILVCVSYWSLALCRHASTHCITTSFFAIMFSNDLQSYVDMHQSTALLAFTLLLCFLLISNLL